MVIIRLFSLCFKFIFLSLLCEDGADSVFVLCQSISCSVVILGHWREVERQENKEGPSSACKGQPSSDPAS